VNSFIPDSIICFCYINSQKINEKTDNEKTSLRINEKECKATKIISFEQGKIQLQPQNQPQIIIKK